MPPPSSSDQLYPSTFDSSDELHRGRNWKLKSLVNLMEEAPESMKKLQMVEPAKNKQHRLFRSHKWKMSKKSSFGAQILNLICVFILFCLRQADLMQIPTFSSILRDLSFHYYMKKPFSNSTSDGLEDSQDMEKK